MRPIALAAIAALTGCSTTPAGPPTCTAGEELFGGACVDPARRYEPASRLDTDNVVAYGGALTQLKLPDPPKSGFRIIAAPRTLAPGEEDETCLSWPYPTFQNHVIYAGRLYTTPGLHHSNLIAKPVDPSVGPNPYPACHPGASDPFSKLPAVIPDVLFANSTQVTGTETLAFPPGKGFTVDPTREILTSIHFLNTTPSPLVVEVAYDFFTMPASDLTDEVAPFVLQVDDFDVPPHATGVIGASCDVFGGSVVEMMPHTHKLATRVTADLITGPDVQRVIDDGPFDAQSHIQMYAPPLDLTNVGQMKFECTFDNTTGQDIHYGIGQNEMCIFFGYVYPAKYQFVAHSSYQGMPCQSVQIGLFR